MSGKVIKINHVKKRQERILLLTDRNVYNINPPATFFGNKIKRKMPYSGILGLSVSRFGSELVIHIFGEDDYRCESPTMKLKFVEMLVCCYCK